MRGGLREAAGGWLHGWRPATRKLESFGAR